MITIYAPNAQDFSTLGLGALAPYECVIEEQAGGMYELTMTHPMDAEGKWLNIGVGCIVKAPLPMTRPMDAGGKRPNTGLGCVLKAPAPVRETSLAAEDAEATAEPVTVTRKIYKVQTNTGANLHLRQGPSTSTAILSKYRPGTEVVVLSQASGWGQVIVCSSGATGYMCMQYLVYVRDETETIEGDAPSPERVVYPVQSRMQLFRIVSTWSGTRRSARCAWTARHIFYDLLGNVVKNEYAPEGEAADAVVEAAVCARAEPARLRACTARRRRERDGRIHAAGACGMPARPGRRRIAADGGAARARQLRRLDFAGRHARDGRDHPPRQEPAGRDADHGLGQPGHAHHPRGAGQRRARPLLLERHDLHGQPAHRRLSRRSARRRWSTTSRSGRRASTTPRRRARNCTELAEADFSDNGVDLPTVGLDVDFVALGETEEYRQLRRPCRPCTSTTRCG